MTEFFNAFSIGCVMFALGLIIGRNSVDYSKYYKKGYDEGFNDGRKELEG